MNILREIKNRVNADARARKARMDEIFTGKAEGENVDFWLDMSDAEGAVPWEMTEVLWGLVPERERRWVQGPTDFLLDYWGRGIARLNRRQATIVDCAVDCYNMQEGRFRIGFGPAPETAHIMAFRMPNGGYRDSWRFS